MINTRLWIGFLLAFYLLVGRWNLARIGVDIDRTYYTQPRLWAVIALAVVVLLDQSISRWRTFRRNAQHPRIGALVLATIVFGAYMCMTALWAPDPALAELRSFDILLNSLVAVLLYLALRGGNPQAIRIEFWKGFALMAAVIALASLMSAQSHRLQSLGGGANTFGRNMGLLVLSGLYLSQVNRTAILRPLWWLAAVSGVLFVLLSGSRGALLSLATSVSTFQAIDRQPLSKKVILFLVASVVGALVITHTQIGLQAQEVFARRILDLTIEQQYTAGRDRIFQDCFELGAEQPILGAGLNAAQAITGFYPHNVFLEAFCEGGVVGLSLLLAVVGFGLSCFARIRRRFNAVTVAAFVHVLVAAQFSGNLFDSRGIFMLLILAAVPVVLPNPKDAGKRDKGHRMTHWPCLPSHLPHLRNDVGRPLNATLAAERPAN